MRREDELIIRELVKKEHEAGTDFVNVYLAQPYFPVDKETFDRIPEQYDEYMPANFSVQDMYNMLPFRSFLFHRLDIPTELQTSLDAMKAKVELVTHVIFPDTPKNPDENWQRAAFASFTFAVLSGNHHTAFTLYRLSARPDPDRPDKGLLLTLDGYDGEDEDRVVFELMNNVHLAVSYTYWMQEQDCYPVEVRGKASSPKYGEKSKKPWTREDLPRTVFLNRMPGEYNHSTSTGTGGHKRGHIRRGHWRRIEHPRFKNHPKFGSRIRVRPAWIGPENVEYKGHTYKLLKEPVHDQVS